MIEEQPWPSGLEGRVEELEQSQRMLELQRRVLEFAARDARLEDTLDELCRMISDLVPDSMSSVMELIENENGPYLKIRSAPAVPQETITLLDGLRPSTQSGSCGTAAFLGEAVIVSDTLTDSRWEPLLELANKIGIRACWSIPIKVGGETVATFAISQTTPQSPTTFQREILDTAGHLAGLAISRDRNQEQLRRSQEQVRQLQKFESLGIMAGGIAHDFNNLLTGVLGNADLALQFLEEGHAASERLHAIRHAARSCSDLCTQMLTYAGRGSVKLQECDLSRVARESMEMMRVVISRSADLHPQFFLDDLLIQADPVQVGQVVVNLLMNAADAVDGKHGVIRVATGVQQVDAKALKRATLSEGLDVGTYAFLEVSDDGHGMSEDVRSRIFDPFFSTRFDGRGLGLASVLGIVKAHGGAIEVCSRPDRGTQIRVLLPLAHEPSAGNRPEPEGQIRAERGTVLIVDDDSIVRDLAMVSLDLMGLQVKEASSGAQAIEIAEMGGVDLILLDLTMPEISGFQVLKRVRELNPRLPVILSSGHADHAALEKLSVNSETLLLPKPYSSRQLRTAVKRLLD